MNHPFSLLCLLIAGLTACGSEIARVNIVVGGQAVMEDMTIDQARYLERLTDSEPPSGTANRCDFWTKAEDDVAVNGRLTEKDREVVSANVSRVQRLWCDAMVAEKTAEKAQETARLVREREEKETEARLEAPAAQEEKEAREKAQTRINSLLDYCDEFITKKELVDASISLDNLAALEKNAEQEARYRELQQRFDKLKPQYLKQKKKAEKQARAIAAAKEREDRESDRKRRSAPFAISSSEFRMNVICNCPVLSYDATANKGIDSAWIVSEVRCFDGDKLRKGYSAPELVKNLATGETTRVEMLYIDVQSQLDFQWCEFRIGTTDNPYIGSPAYFDTRCWSAKGAGCGK
jgi:hypothetical protein